MGTLHPQMFSMCFYSPSHLLFKDSVYVLFTIVSLAPTMVSDTYQLLSQHVLPNHMDLLPG